ncbi:Flp family type IVb pilin [Sulfitobacter sp. R18_1]|uniref:Flp family type IVb pilin n=1 Tax=Sulfitobacter sp. R18_1 TaxID=2821104 RepID=UPI001ADA0978|nr:Flp family type IVb pilin [Sulfitobacter sp. R18_1]MBO9432442.1 Flp family type IVb pilin [Sulfitobacter sp. R18_1]
MIIKFLNTFARDEDGATAIEYGLFAALIAAVLVTTVSLLGEDLDTTFEGIRTALGYEAQET